MAELLWWHRAGQRVVCVYEPRDRGLGCEFAPLQLSHVYTVREVVNWNSDEVGYRIGFYLQEIRNPVVLTKAGWVERTYSTSHFRPVRETSIESLRGLLSPTPDDVRRLAEDVDA